MSEKFAIGDEILEILKGSLSIRAGEFAALDAGVGDPFRVLVATIISQNTNERNTYLALDRLERVIGVDPPRLLSTGVEAIEKVIAVSGLQGQKARAIHEAARLVIERYNGDMKKLLELGEEKVRVELSSIRGIGDKTIDVLLAFSGFPVLPVDTHVKRVSRRLGLTNSSSYNGIKRDLHNVFRKEVRLLAHLLLIKLGREICKARAPLCSRCPLLSKCPSASLEQKTNVPTREGGE
ncbi:MAG: hypothetical protein NZ954_00925 [Thermofilaceae archaeon]|nr:hypothetical protein [Thermofilaceae archaeon]MCX8180255.1 hypothetical protein [Thermofilaceae archaeon]MDW8004025.1 hypothetical protein [Thermofilaceae archaeon]